MSTTAFEILLNRRGDETEIPSGDFRNCLVDIINFIKEYRGSEIALPEYGEIVFDPLLPTVEQFFVAMTEALQYWYLSFTGYQIFTIENNLFVIDDGIYGVYPYLSIQEGQVDPIGDEEEVDLNRTYAPYFHELTRAALPVDEEFAFILEMLSAGDYPRYNQYGTVLFLLDLIWWGWQSFLGEPDGRGGGDISFFVNQKLGLRQLSFNCTIAFGQQTISLAEAQNVNNYSNVATNFKALNASGLNFTKFPGLDEFTDELPDIAIGITLGGIKDSLNITDIVLRFQPPNSRFNNPIVYNCNPLKNNSIQEMPLIAVRASFSKNNFVLNKRLLNDTAIASGIQASVTSKSSLGLLFKAQNPSDYGGENLSYSLQIFSGARLIASEYFSISPRLNKVLVEDV